MPHTHSNTQAQTHRPQARTYTGMQTHTDSTTAWHATPTHGAWQCIARHDKTRHDIALHATARHVTTRRHGMPQHGLTGGDGYGLGLVNGWRWLWVRAGDRATPQSNPTTLMQPRPPPPQCSAATYGMAQHFTARHGAAIVRHGMTRRFTPERGTATATVTTQTVSCAHPQRTTCKPACTHARTYRKCNVPLCHL